MSNPAFAFDHVHIISKTPKESAQWYVDVLGADIAADTIARGAAQIYVKLGGATIVIRGQRPGEATYPRPQQTRCADGLPRRPDYIRAPRNDGRGRAVPNSYGSR